MYQLAVYSASVTNGLTDVDLAAVNDPVLTRQNSHYTFPRDMRLYAALYIGTSADRARLQCPRFRGFVAPYIYPHVAAAAMPTDPNIADYRSNPLVIPAEEEISVEVTHTNAGAQQQTVGLFVGDGNFSVPAGQEVFTVRCTAAITTVAYTYGSGALTFGQSLPRGKYAVLGAQVQSATGLFYRLIFPDQAWRPGGVAVPTIGLRPPWQGQKGPLGVLGTFFQNNPPQLEMFCTGVDSAQVALLDLVRLQ